MDIIKELEKIVKAQKSNLPPMDLKTEFDGLGFDSLDKMNILMEVEECFNIELGDDLSLKTVGDLVDLIKSKIK